MTAAAAIPWETTGGLGSVTRTLARQTAGGKAKAHGPSFSDATLFGQLSTITPAHLLLAEEGSQLPRHRKAVVWRPTATSRFHTQAALGLAVRSPDQSSQRQQTEKEALTSKTMNPPTLFPVPTAPHIPNLNSDSKGQRVSVTHTASFQPWSCTPPWKGSLTTKTWWPEVGAGSRYDVKNPGRKAFAFSTPGVQGAGLVLRNPVSTQVTVAPGTAA